MGSKPQVAAEDDRADEEGRPGIGIDAVDPAAPVRGRAEALSQATPPRKGQGGRGRRRKGILAEVASEKDEDLPERGRGQEGRLEKGGAAAAAADPSAGA